MWFHLMKSNAECVKYPMTSQHSLLKNARPFQKGLRSLDALSHRQRMECRPNDALPQQNPSKRLGGQNCKRRIKNIHLCCAFHRGWGRPFGDLLTHQLNVRLSRVKVLYVFSPFIYIFMSSCSVCISSFVSVMCIVPYTSKNINRVKPEPPFVKLIFSLTRQEKEKRN